MSVSQGCVNYAGTGTISITGVSNGSGNYVYHIGGSIDFNDPNAYNLNSSASGLANGNYSVAVYDSSTGVNVNETRNINCPAAPPPTPPSPPPTPPSPPPTPPSYYTFFLSIGKDNFGDACLESSYPSTVYAPNTPVDYNTTLYTDITFTTPFGSLQDYWYKDDASGKALQLDSGGTIIQYIQC